MPVRDPVTGFPIGEPPRYTSSVSRSATSPSNVNVAPRSVSPSRGNNWQVVRDEIVEKPGRRHGEPWREIHREIHHYEADGREIRNPEVRETVKEVHDPPPRPVTRETRVIHHEEPPRDYYRERHIYHNNHSQTSYYRYHNEPRNDGCFGNCFRNNGRGSSRNRVCCSCCKRQVI